MLWFNPKNFDKIIIVFRDRLGDTEFNQNRLRALSNHPLREKIICLNYEESGILNRKIEEKIRFERFTDNWHRLELDLPKVIKHNSHEQELVIFTHNQWGEYGHPEHIMINAVVNTVLGMFPIFCPEDVVANRNEDSFRVIEQTTDTYHFLGLREFYKQYNIWTFRDNYLPPPIIKYYEEDKKKFELRNTKIII